MTLFFLTILLSTQVKEDDCKLKQDCKENKEPTNENKIYSSINKYVRNEALIDKANVLINFDDLLLIMVKCILDVIMRFTII